MDHQIGAPAGVDALAAVKDRLQKVAQMVFGMHLGLAQVNAVKERAKCRLKALHVASGCFLAQIGLVECLSQTEGAVLHVLGLFAITRDLSTANTH